MTKSSLHTKLLSIFQATFNYHSQEMILDFQSYIALEPKDANAELIMGKLFN